jgi:hypothetical protein
MRDPSRKLRAQNKWKRRFSLMTPLCLQNLNGRSRKWRDGGVFRPTYIVEIKPSSVHINLRASVVDMGSKRSSGQINRTIIWSFFSVGSGQSVVKGIFEGWVSSWTTKAFMVQNWNENEGQSGDRTPHTDALTGNSGRRALFPNAGNM